MLTVLLITLQRYNKFVFVPNFFFRFYSTTVDKNLFFGQNRLFPPPFLSTTKGVVTDLVFCLIQGLLAKSRR